MRSWLKRISGIILLLCWGTVVVNITLISRNTSAVSSYQLHLFWCIEDAWINKSADNWYFVVGNILMFIPLGIILPSFFDCMRHSLRTTAAGLFLSVCIEMIQLFFHLGLFEFDDMFNNALGAFLGYGIFVLVKGLFHKGWVGTRMERIILFSIWIIVIGFLTVALFMGQPVFDQLKDALLFFPIR